MTATALDESVDEACELLTHALTEGTGVVVGEHSWFAVGVASGPDEIYEMETGAEVTGATVTVSGVTVRGYRKMGEGRTPYADDPAHHRELANHPTLDRTEGAVVYPDYDRLNLPKTLYFKEEVPFDRSSAVDSVPGLSEAVSQALGIEVEYGYRDSGGPNRAQPPC